MPVDGYDSRRKTSSAPKNPSTVFAGAAKLAVAAAGTFSKTPDGLVACAMTQSGDQYIFGAEASPSNPNPGAFDCSELVEWACARIGVKITDGSEAQYQACKKAGLAIPVREGIQTRGALLFNNAGANRVHHVAISRGDGTTIEAKGRKWGVGVFPATTGRFTLAGRIPGLNYGAKGAGGSSGGGTGGGGSTPAPPSYDPGLFLKLIAAIIHSMGTRIKVGANEAAVKIMQVRLQQLGYPVPVTGRFDNTTKACLQQFQSKSRLRADGVCGPTTWAKLYPDLKQYAIVSQKDGPPGWTM